MLVMTRKKGETILIGDSIKISVLEVDGDKVSIGIDAPRDIKVVREELIVQTIDYNKESLISTTDVLERFKSLNQK